MSPASRVKRNRSRVGGMVPESGAIQTRKEDNVQLHDEADLVNFRTDAYSRFLNNQELLENATLKPFHTSQIIPPPSFPVHTEKKYPETATDKEVEQTVKDMKPDELFMGDLRLMKAKMLVSLAEMTEAQKELTELSPNVVFSEKSRFQNLAVRKLAALQLSCTDASSFATLESALDQILTQYKEKFGGELKLQNQAYLIRKMPVSKLAPDAEVKLAPQLYNPRLIMSFIDMNDNNSGDISAQGFPDENMLLDTDKLAGQLPFMNGMQGNDEFGMVMDKPGGAGEYGYNGNYNVDYGGNYVKSAGGNGHGLAAGLGDEDMNMDELNQFLAEPNDNEGVDDMDALMNFDQDNENGEMMGDDEFNVNFLQMDNEME